MLNAQELVRCYGNLVEDSTRVMLRVKALFRARAISNAWRIGLSYLATQALAGEARGRRPRPCRVPVEPTGCAERAAAEGKGRDDRGGTPAARLEGPAHDPVPRPGAGGVPAGDHARGEARESLSKDVPPDSSHVEALA
jgi:hypothetical protein